MTQIQFRSDDSSRWAQRFGNGSDGDLTIASPLTDSPVNTTFVGALGAVTGTLGSGTGFVVGNIVLIHQSQGTNAGTWQLNYIVGISGASVTFLYPLVATFGTGCQIQKLFQYRNITVGGLLTVSSWNGSKGGILAFLASTAITVNSTISLSGAGGGQRTPENSGSVGPTTGGGFFGGIGTNTPNAWSGEGYSGPSTIATANRGDNGGGGGSNGDSGAGGGNGTAGANSAGANEIGGIVSGNAALTQMVFGGGGGGGQASNGVGAGGSGGAIGILIAPVITFNQSANLNGGNGGSPGGGRGGGGGAGGSLLLKGKQISVGSNIITANGGSGGTGPEGNGGSGGVGRIHADYSLTFSGSSTPSIDTRQDLIFNDTGGAIFGAFL